MRKKLFFKFPDMVGNYHSHYIRFVCYLFVFWLLITGSLHLKFLIIGGAASFIVAWICMPLFTIPNRSRTKHYFMLDVRIVPLIAYVFWLLKELILSNMDVAKTIWKKELPIKPELIRFQVHFDNPLAIAMLANSITLTPGTITLDSDAENVYVIHALTPTAAEGIRQGGMVKKIAALFHENTDFHILDPKDC